jgi:FKBP-type peptidyl-prolyl cis-trans isomerase
MPAYEEEDATAAEIRRAPPVPFSRMFNGVKTSASVNQAALMTSLQTHFGCSLTGRTDRGDDIADLLEDAIDFMAPLKYEDLWSETLLRHLPSELATQARVLDPNADHEALEREARSTLMEALDWSESHIMETYDLLADRSVPASMQGELIDALLAELEEGVERETAPVTARLTDLCRPRAMVVSTNAEREKTETHQRAAETARMAAAALETAALELRRPRTIVSTTPRIEENEKKRAEKTQAAEEAKKREEKAKAAEEKKRTGQKRKERTVAQTSELEATERRRTTRNAFLPSLLM